MTIGPLYRLACRPAIFGRESSLFNRLWRQSRPTSDAPVSQTRPGPVRALEAGRVLVDAPPD